MNRPIKFRAFVRGYIVDVVSIDFVNQYITWDDNQYDRCVPPNKCYEIASFDEIKLLQWTGLYDKNGLEIFEGDVVRREVINREWDEIDNPIKEKWSKEISFIEYRHSGFLVAAEHFGWEGESMWDWNEIEVIGSIFTHPELVQTIK